MIIAGGPLAAGGRIGVECKQCNNGVQLHQPPHITSSLAGDYFH